MDETQPPQHIDLARAQAEAPGVGGARILFIDDEAQVARAVRAGLALSGFVVEWAATGKEGIERIAQWHPDVILLDLTLPDIDGLEVCRQVREWSQVPIIVLSVRSADADKIAALELALMIILPSPSAWVNSSLVSVWRCGMWLSAPAAREAQARFQSGSLAIDLERRQVTVDGSEVHGVVLWNRRLARYR